jgi:hypothetical protein
MRVLCIAFWGMIWGMMMYAVLALTFAFVLGASVRDDKLRTLEINLSDNQSIKRALV